MAVVGLAFLRVNQNLISVVDLLELSLQSATWNGEGTRLLKSFFCLSLVRGWSTVGVCLKCTFLVCLSD